MPDPAPSPTTSGPPGRRLHLTEVGDTGARVVFLHGLFGQGRNFLQIAKALQPELRSVLVDLPNHGRSAWTESVGYEAVAGLVASELRQRYGDEGRFHLVGHSMGGKVAMTLALTEPDLVERLVVVDIAPAGSGGRGEFEHLLDSLAGLDLASLTRRADADRALTEKIRSTAVRGFLLQNLRSDGDGFRWQANLELLRRELDTIGGFPELDAVFERPVLWISGASSDYVRPEHEPTMRRLFPRSRALVVKNAGHWVHSEQPDVFVTALRSFLA